MDKLKRVTSIGKFQIFFYYTLCWFLDDFLAFFSCSVIGVVLGHSTIFHHSTRSIWYVNIGDISTEEILQDKSTNFSKGKGKVVLKSAQEDNLKLGSYSQKTSSW